MSCLNHLQLWRFTTGFTTTTTTTTTTSWGLNQEQGMKPTDMGLKRQKHGPPTGHISREDTRSKCVNTIMSCPILGIWIDT